MSVSFTIPDSVPIHPPCPPWCAECASSDWDALHHLGHQFVVPLAGTEDEANIALIQLTRLDIDGHEAPTGVWVTVDSQQLFSSLSLTATEQLAHALLAAVHTARTGAL